MVEEARKALLEFMEVSKKSQKQIAKETGLSTSTISQFLKGTYAGDNEEVATTITNFLRVGNERLKLVESTVFNESLYNTQQVLFAASYAHKKCDIALVCGDAGAGKTTALKHYSENNTGVIFVTADPCTASATAILTLIAESLGKKIPTRGQMLTKSLISALNNTNKLIIIDEADLLTLNALQAIRTLNDKAHVGIVLSGNDKVYTQMLSPRRGTEFDQIRTRIIVRKRVENQYSIEDIYSIFPSIDKTSAMYILKLACEESLRTAVKIYDIAFGVAVTAGKPMSVDYIKSSQSQLLGEVY